MDLAMTVAEGLAVALGLAYLLLAIRERRSCWVAGALASLLFGAVFWRAGLSMQALLQGYYVAVAVHGWYHWGSDRHSAARVHYLGPRNHAGLLLLWLLAVLATQALRQDPAALAGWLDSLTSWGGVLATWLVARKAVEAWIYWIAIDAATVILYLDADLLPSAGLFTLYTALAVAGWRAWRKHYRQLQGTSSNASA
jgi:nicotinamide mononucleotide transporter